MHLTSLRTLAVIILLLSDVAVAATPNRVTILYDSFGKNPALTNDWGFAALVEYGGKRILFDTGNNAQIFEHNVKAAGVDLIDCSSGALVPGEKIPSGHPFQVPFAAQIRREAGIATGAVGFIVDPTLAEGILQEESADLVLLARALLDDPYWPRHAAARLNVEPHWPIQYARAVRHFHDSHWRANALGPGRAAD